MLLSPVVVALIWKWILQRDGLLNAALTLSGGEKILFFVEPGWAMFWAVFVSVWAHMGFYTLILLAGLQAIPADLYEAAEMDGTPPMARVLTRLTLPLLWPNLIVVLVLALIRAVQTFDEVFVLTGGGPGTATLMVVQYIYETAFANQVQNFGLASAASVLLGRACCSPLTLRPARASPAGRPRDGKGSSASLLTTRARCRPARTGPISLPTPTSCFGVVLMFGPVIWLVLSSFKTQAALLEFPPSLPADDAEDGCGAGPCPAAAALSR